MQLVPIRTFSTSGLHISSRYGFEFYGNFNCSALASYINIIYILIITLQTQTCVPNPYAIQALAPAYDADICPHWAERWDIRTRPLGCQVSTITSLTCIISVLSTLAFLLLSWLAIRGIQRFSVFHKRHPDWWRRVWDYEWWPAWFKWMNPVNWTDDAWDRQRQPLLGAAGALQPSMQPGPERPDGGSNKDDSDTDDDDDGDDDDNDDTDSDSS